MIVTPAITVAAIVEATLRIAAATATKRNFAKSIAVMLQNQVKFKLQVL